MREDEMERIVEMFDTDREFRIIGLVSSHHTAISDDILVYYDLCS